MAKSRSEPSLSPSPLKIRGARGVMKRFAKGNRTVPGPGRRPIGSSLRGAQRRSNLIKGSLI